MKRDTFKLNHLNIVLGNLSNYRLAQVPQSEIESRENQRASETQDISEGTKLEATTDGGGAEIRVSLSRKSSRKIDTKMSDSK